MACPIHGELCYFEPTCQHCQRMLELRRLDRWLLGLSGFQLYLLSATLAVGIGLLAEAIKWLLGGVR